jgi:hypothetical protein
VLIVVNLLVFSIKERRIFGGDKKKEEKRHLRGGMGADGMFSGSHCPARFNNF